MKSTPFYTDVELDGQIWPIPTADWEADPDTVKKAIRRHKRHAKTLAQLVESSP